GSGKPSRGGRRGNRKGAKKGKVGGGGGSNGKRASGPQKVCAVINQASVVDGGRTCDVCGDVVKYTAITPCNHGTCHVCSLRLRALFRNKACVICRTESDYVIFTKDDKKSFEDFGESDIYSWEEQLGIMYQLQEIEQDTNALLRFRCPDRSCEQSCSGWPDLYRHVEKEHGKLMCELCTSNKKAFTSEHMLFTRQELKSHKSGGDDKPGSKTQSGFKGHPKCGFCADHYYSYDELFNHCREKHERCFICDRNSTSSNIQYYNNYGSLEEHFKESHFVCPDAECVEEKFVVFENKSDLNAHELEVHRNGRNKHAWIDGTGFDISHFQVAGSLHDGGRRRRRGGRNRDNTAGHGREENDVPIHIKESRQQRGELAHQRTQQLPIHSAQTITSRTFGGQLTHPAEAFPPLGTILPCGNVAPVAPRNAPSLGRISSKGSLSQNAEIIEHASKMLGFDKERIGQFRGYISRYNRELEPDSDEFIGNLWRLFGVEQSSAQQVAEFGTVIMELARGCEQKLKQKKLKQSWLTLQAIFE
ncbi:hypothetical protein BZA77DRAFT_367695, partial [Pyronema omphalodes]